MLLPCLFSSSLRTFATTDSSRLPRLSSESETCLHPMWRLPTAWRSTSVTRTRPPDCTNQFATNSSFTESSGPGGWGGRQWPTTERSAWMRICRAHCNGKRGDEWCKPFWKRCNSRRARCLSHRFRAKNNTVTCRKHVRMPGPEAVILSSRESRD